MYKLSYEKCVCFVFLVMVAFLSCSGFRIDRLAMTDISKRNSYTSSTTSLNLHSDFLNRLSQTGADGVAERSPTRPEPLPSRTSRHLRRPHRIRHSRRSRHHPDQPQQPYETTPNPHHKPPPTARIDAIVIEPPPTTRPTTNEKYAQIPPSNTHPLKPTASIITRPQRSPNRSRQQHRNSKQPCQEQDFARKAYLANTVVLAKAESMSSNRIKNYSVSFKILERFKSPPYAVDDNLRLAFLNETRRMNCESELHGGSQGVVKAQIQQSKVYYLFLNSHGNHNYTVLGTPVLKRPKKNSREIDRILGSVTSRNFEPKLKKPTAVNTTATNLQPRSKLRLVCRVKGYPIPVISWKKNNTILHNNNNTRITFSNKGRKSTLVIKVAQERDSGHYYCVATGVDGQRMTSAPIEIRITNREKCTSELRNTFCQNGGTCYITSPFIDYYCVCPDGFTGNKCEKKTVNFNIGSMYRPCIYGLPAYYC